MFLRESPPAELHGAGTCEVFTGAKFDKIFPGYQPCQLVNNQRFRDRQGVMSRCHNPEDHSINDDSHENLKDLLCGLVVRVSGYISGGPGFDSRRFHIFSVAAGLEGGPPSLVWTTVEILEGKK
jgi:hypothetical protein